MPRVTLEPGDPPTRRDTIDASRPQAWLGRRAWAVLFAAVNGGLFLAHPRVLDALPSPIAALVVAAAVFLLPGTIGMATASRARRIESQLAVCVAISTLVLCGILATLRVLGVPPDRGLVWMAIGTLANAGILAAARKGRPARGRRALAGTEAGIALLLFHSSFALYHHGATRVVPPQVDHDLEVQATGHALLTRLEPLLLTDRHTVYYFAHPPLLHFYTAASFLLHGSFDRLEFYDAASVRARESREQGAPAAVQESLERRELAQIYERYRQEPHLLETRTPNLFLASATVALLGILAYRVSRRWPVALLVACAYATSPEVFVRSSYGGYFAIGGFFSILVLLGLGRRRAAGRRIDPASALLALSDHKMVLLPAAVAAARGLAGLGGLGRHAPAARPVVAGFGLGTLLFWGYGATIAPAAFLEDHIGHHLVDRLRHANPLGYTGYPAPAELWLEFLRNTGYVLLPAALGLLACDLALRTSGAARLRAARLVWMVWILVVGGSFSIVDWRMTKHLVPILLPLHLALLAAPDAPRWRRIAPLAVLAFLVPWNIDQLWRLAHDFASFRVTPAW